MNRTITLLCALILSTLTACSSGGGGSSSGPGSGSSGPVPMPTSLGTPTGAPSSAVIGAAGGTVSTPDSRITISIPAGALASNTTITIQPITNMAHGGLGVGYRLLPEGQVFAQPLKLTLAYTDADLDGTGPKALGIAVQNAGGYWELQDLVTQLDATAKTLTATVSHFSDWSLVSQLRLFPRIARVMVQDAILYEVRMSYEIRGERDPATYERPVLGYDWYKIGPSIGAILLSDWAINGIIGGNSTLGTIVGQAEYGAYSAPATKPTPDVVYVSVQVKDLKDNTKSPLTAFLQIIDKNYYYGKITFNGTIVDVDSTITYAGDAWVDFRVSQDISTSTMYAVSPGPATTVRFTQWDYQDSTKTCSLVADAITPFQFTGWLTVLKNMPSYSFTGALQAQGTHACTYKSTGEKITEAVYPLAMLLSSSSPADPGILPLGSAAPDISGKADFIDIGKTQHSDWYFVRMP